MRILRPDEISQWPGPRDMTPEEVKEALRLAREAFTAADLQKYTELDEGVPMEELLAELEEMLRQAEQRPS